MYFIAAKVLWLVFSPSNLVFALVAAGVLLMLTRWRRLGVGSAAVGLLLVVVLGFSPASRLLVRPLEQRFPAWVDDGRPLSGIIVLGGPVEQEMSLAHGQLSFNESGERVTAMAALARAYPSVPVLFTGGSASLVGDEPAEAAILGRYVETLGLPPGRILLEERSRNTVENALFSRDLLKPGPSDRYLLVTSAFHMPRSMGLFRQAGFTVLPWPVDFRTTGSDSDFAPYQRIADGLRMTDFAVREWLGLVSARALGQTSALLPGP